MIASAVLTCALSASEAVFVQEALDGWGVITHELLALPDEPLPWMILYGRTCAYHLAPDEATPLGRETRPVATALRYAGSAVTVHALAVTDDVPLPDGQRLPVAGRAFTSLYERDGVIRPFFVTALPEVWASDPRYADDTDDWRGFVLGVLSHELVHTRQIVAIAARVEELHERHPILPETLDDDWLQKKFEKEPTVDQLVRDEVELLHLAVAEKDPESARLLARAAVRMTRFRREKVYGAEHAAYSALEDLFLNMEGVACWSAFELSVRRRAGVPREDVLSAIRDNRKWWSQEEGLALFLALDRFVPDWRRRVFPPELAGPVDLLEAAVGDR